MNKKALIILFLISFMLYNSNSVYSQEVSDKVISDKVIIDVIKERKSEVTLEHKMHVEEYKAECKDCHHTYDPKEGEPKYCVECHDFSEPKILEGRRVEIIKTTTMKNIYHDKCNPCHEKTQRAGKPFPKKCSVCHPVRE
jgi:hypothetical protein